MQRWVSTACACAWIFSFASSTAAVPSDSAEDSRVADSTPSAAGLVPSADLSPVVSDAKNLLDQGKASEAYELLSQHEVELAGTADFDYLFGLAALDSRHPKEAAFALERVVAAQPEFLGARL